MHKNKELVKDMPGPNQRITVGKLLVCLPIVIITNARE